MLTKFSLYLSNQLKKFSYSYICFLGLTAYCIVLIFLEIKVSQKFVRNFFTDIEGPVPFYAVNTTLSVFLLFATALMFAVCLVCLQPGKKNKAKVNFYRSQILLFGYLACDDRFLLHEKLGAMLGIQDALILIGLGMLEIWLIVTWGNFSQWNQKTKNNIYKAAICFAVMVAIDSFLPREMIPRLSLEDLSKTWANTFIFLFSWSMFCHNVAILKKMAKT